MRALFIVVTLCLSLILCYEDMTRLCVSRLQINFFLLLLIAQYIFKGFSADKLIVSFKGLLAFLLMLLFLHFLTALILNRKLLEVVGPADIKTLALFSFVLSPSDFCLCLFISLAGGLITKSLYGKIKEFPMLPAIFLGGLPLFFI